MQTTEEDSEVMDSEGNETVYDNQTDDSHVMSERVQNLASSIYTEFERLIKAYDEDVVKDLMPLVVGILEGLDNVLLDKQEKEVDLELLKDDNEQLITQYEREKQLRKASEQKLLELDDMREEEMKEMESKVESMESLLRMFELKAKNSQDHIARLEDKESEMRKEYTKLHDRYTELFKTHVDHMERTKMLMGGERIMEMGSNALPRGQGGFQTPSLRPVNASLGLYPTADAASIVDTPTTDTPPTLDTPQADTSNMSLHNEFQQQAEASAETDDAAKALKTKEEKDSHNKSSIQADNKIHDELHVLSSPLPQSSDDILSPDQLPPPEHTSADLVASTPELETFDEQYSGPSAHTTDNSAPASRNENSLFTEIRHDDSSDVGNMLDITGKVIHPGEYSSAGVGKEVENLILENTELLTTKNALNIVKDDLIAKVDELQSEQEIQREEIASLQAMKSRLKARVTELEEDLKKTKDDLEKQKELAKNQPQDEDDVPLAQRKRFTRVEMARVLMERNQYKERLMELQEAVRYTEMIRASREHPELATKKKGSIWNFFGNLFMTPNKPQKKQLPSATIKYSAASTNVRPVGDPNKKNRDKLIGDKGKAYNFLQDDALADKCRREREQERREQYKQVRAHVKKDDGRMQAYGWSLPAKFPTSSQSSSSPNNSGSSDGSKQRTDTRGSHVPVPVPVYCHPLLSREPGIKIWCAAGVNLSGGVTKDGGSVVGASVFYSNNSPTEKMDNDKPGVTSTKDSVERLNQELKDHESNMSSCSSSLVWICTTSQNHNSNMLIIDANKPSQILESFTAGNSHILCVASVPGATADDYTSSRSKSLLDDMEMEIEDLDNMSPSSSPPKSSGPVDLNNIKVVQCATGGEGGASGGGEGGASGGGAEDTNRVEGSTSRVEGSTSGEEGGTSSSSPPSSAGTSAASEAASTSKDGNDNSNETSEPSVKHVRNAKPIHDTTSSSGSTDAHITSVAPTMWLGSQSGSLYVHPAAHHWKTCLHSVKLNDSILSITHANGRVIVALANSTMVVFHRDSDGIWDLSSYYVVDLGRPQHSVRCLCVIGNKQVWCGRRNKIHVLDPNSLQIQKSFSAHPRKESQIRQLAWIGDGVWVSIRLDSTLRLYHAYTHHHLQDVDIEPYVSKMLGTGKLGFSFVRITSLMVSCSRLWIGTGNGVIISVPLSESNKQTVTGTTTGRPGGIIRVYSDTKTGAVTPGSFIPYCSMAQAQLSFHGHKDAVKFFVAVAGSPPKSLTSTASTSANNNSSSPTTDTPPPAGASGGTSASSSPAHTASSSAATTASSMLLMSGGEGYVDFRIGDIEDDSDGLTGDEKPSGSLSKGDRSHLIVWSLACR